MLKLYFPQAIDLVGPLHGPLALELLGRWPTLKKLQRANPKTLQKFFRQHGQRNDEKIKEQVQQIRAFRHLTPDYHGCAMCEALWWISVRRDRVGLN